MPLASLTKLRLFAPLVSPIDVRKPFASYVSVLTPLPPLLETYALTAEVWARSVPAFTRQNLSFLDEGITYFPRNVPLIYQAAWLNARQGFTTEADDLITRGLNAGADPAFRTRLEQLRSKLVLVNNASAAAHSAAPAQP